MRRFPVALAFLFCGTLAFAADGSSYSLDVDLTPTSPNGGYLCKAVIKDLDTGEVVSAPSIALLADTWGSTRTSAGDLVADLRIAVDSKTSRATAELKVLRAGKPVAAQRMSVAIR